MSTFGILLMLLFLIIFGTQIIFYCFNIKKELLSEIFTLALFLMLITEIILTFYEFIAQVIDVIVYISMGYRVIAIGCGVVIFTVIAFIFLMLYPKIPWERLLSAGLLKYVIVGALVIGFMTYTEVFNGSYSFDSLDEYYSFKAEFSQYDNRFWPTKFIKGYKEKGSGYVDTYSVYPWDVELSSGHESAYMVITFYEKDEADGVTKFYYYPFTYKLYAGSKPVEVKPKGYVAPSSGTNVSSSDF